jgi:hypothetical protein
MLDGVECRSEVKPRSEHNAGKRWSTLDKRDLADALDRGDSIADAASFMLRPVDEIARKAAELGLLTKSGKYTIDLYYDDGDGGGVEQELAREDRLDVARALHELMCAQYPGRQVLLRQGAQVLRRSPDHK